ncbi:MAG: HAMP domain-containing sensor histidine kinase [Nitrososphaeraceae archaeon]
MSSNSSSATTTAASLEKTEIFHGSESVINTVLQFASKTKNRIDTCVDNTRPALVIENEQLRKSFMDAKNAGIRSRCITEVTAENIPYCKELLQIVNELRHLNGIKGNFYLSESEYLSPATLHEKGKPASQIIYSNVKEIVEHQRYIFETLWNKSIPAKDKIIEIENEIEPEFLEVISDCKKATEIYVELARSLKKEALFLLSDSKAMIRADKLGIIDNLIEASSQGSAVVKMICPLSEENSDIIKRISQRAPYIKIINGGSSHSGLFVVDSAKFLRFELKDPKAEEFSEAIGFVVYSNSKVSVKSSKSLFELIWNEHLQYGKLQEYERRKEADKMKNEFINIAAHELRTPIQPILSLSQIMRSQKVNIDEYHEFLDVIISSAKRLQRLANDILDATQIESHLLKLDKKLFNLNETISDVVQGYKQQIETRNRTNNNNLKLVLESNAGATITLKADKNKISQVLSNLLSNAIKFTREGTILVKAEKNKGGKEANLDEVIVSVKDTGTGIDPEIFPRLFSMFVSKSYEDTGLGLFISKSIIEAHGGKMWAENNKDGMGARFSFKIPIK